MKLSVTTYPWGKLRTTDQFRSVLDAINEIGFEGVGIEFSLLPQELKDNPEMLPAIIRKARLENGGTYSPGSRKELEWSRVSKTPLLWVSVKAKTEAMALNRLRSFARLSRKYRIITALHNELRSSFQKQPQLEKALDSIKELSFCLDTAHGEGAGVDCLGMIEKYSKKLALVHLKDLKAKMPISKIRFTRDFVNIGKGIVDLNAVVEKLDEVGYKGQLMLEIEALENQDPANAVREGFEYMNRLIK